MKHLKDTGLNYFSHWFEAMTYSLVLFIHAWLPDYYSTYVSDKIKERNVQHICLRGFHRFPEPRPGCPRQRIHDQSEENHGQSEKYPAGQFPVSGLAIWLHRHIHSELQ